jgi:DNA-binding transcriptional LysR family regulator
MDLRQLRYFIAVADAGTISAAARELHLTQPALSRQVKALEDSLGWPLLERGKQSVSLTAAGETVAREGRKILSRVERGLATMRREIEGVVLRVGYAPSLAGGILGPALACFTQLHPQVRVELLDLSSVGLAGGLRSGELDMVVGNCDRSLADVEWSLVKTVGWTVAMGVEHPLAKHPVLGKSHLDGERLLLYCRADYPAYWESVTRYFQDQQIDAKIAGEYDGITSLTTALEGGLGVALVAGTTRFGSDANVVMRPFDPSPPPLPVSAGVAGKGPAHKWAQAFVAELRKAATP